MTTSGGDWGDLPTLFTGADPLEVARELRAMIEARITGADRSQQVRLGPSGLGTTCLRCLVLGLAEVQPPRNGPAPWLPAIGTAMHEWLESMIVSADDLQSRWLPENKVTVGLIRGQEFTGHSDVFHVPSGTVVDWKLVGTSVMRSLTKGPKPIYLRQAMLYGKGWENAGFQVRAVLIFYLPRNGRTLDEARPVLMPYDRSIAEWALKRAEDWAAVIANYGLDGALMLTGPHNYDEFSCKDYEGES